jgi:hypothetical protein
VTRLSIWAHRLVVTEFLDAFRIYEEQGGDALHALLRAMAEKAGLGGLPPYWVEANNDSRRLWARARVWYVNL